MNEKTEALSAVPGKMGEVVVTTNESGQCVFVSRQDEEGQILSVIWEAPSLPQSTHWEGCWNGGRKHYECAVAEIERRAARQQPVAATDDFGKFEITPLSPKQRDLRDKARANLTKVASAGGEEPVLYVALVELQSAAAARKNGDKWNTLAWSEPTGQAGIPLFTRSATDEGKV